MKDSGVEWIGKIPKEWKLRPIKRWLSNHDSGAWGSEHCGDDNDVICIRVADFDFPRLTVKQNWQFTTRNYDEGTIKRLILMQQDILVEKSGGGADTPVGRAIMFNGEFPALFANFIDRLRVSQNYNPRYFLYVWSVLYLSGYINAFIKQTTGIQNLDIRSLDSQTSMPEPSQPEQHCIADYLDDKCSKIDSIIEKENAIIEKLKEYRQSVITEAVTKGLDPNVPMKDSGIEWIGKIPTNFNLYRFKYILKKPLQYGANQSGIVYSENLPRYIRITDINSEGKLKNDGMLSLAPEIASDYILHDGDILFARSGATVGKTFIYKNTYGNCAYAGYLIRATLNSKALPQYVYYFTLTTIYDLWKNGIFIQSTIQNIGADKYSNMPIVLPNIDNQKKIILYLDSKCSKIDSIIAKKQQAVDKLTEYKKSLIYEVVTGKKEV